MKNLMVACAGLAATFGAGGAASAWEDGATQLAALDYDAQLNIEVDRIADAVERGVDALLAAHPNSPSEDVQALVLKLVYGKDVCDTDGLADQMVGRLALGHLSRTADSLLLISAAEAVLVQTRAGCGGATAVTALEQPAAEASSRPTWVNLGSLSTRADYGGGSPDYTRP